MKKLYVRFAFTMLLVVALSSLVATVLTYFVGVYVFPQEWEHKVFLAFRIRDILMPFLTIASCAAFISLTSKKAVAPIVALSDAATEITHGNFDVAVEVSKRQDEISDLQRNFNIMAKELKSSQLMKKDFVATISHEFKTPLSIIQGYGKLLASGSLSPEERSVYAQKLETETQKLIALTSNILRLSKLDSQSINPEPSRFRLDEQIRQAVLSLQPAWQGKQMEIDLALKEQWYHGDEELIAQIWVNLIDNAVKFSPESGIIGIRMINMGDSVQVKVTDQGPGMDKTTQAHAFDEFYQGSNTSAKEGIGLGLAIVRRIVELHSGRIQMESTNKGTRFTVTLPLER